MILERRRGGQTRRMWNEEVEKKTELESKRGGRARRRWKEKLVGKNANTFIGDLKSCL